MRRHQTIRRIRLLMMSSCLAFASCAYQRGLDPAPHEFSPSAEADSKQVFAFRDSQPVQSSDTHGNDQAQADGPLTLSLPAAVLMALENNASFRIESLQPGISRTDEQIQRAAFDPTITGSISGRQSHDETVNDGGGTNDITDSESIAANIQLNNNLPIGMTVALDIGGDTQSADNGGATETRGADWGLTLSQALLRGRGTDANLARLRQARLGTEISLHEFRGSAEALVTQVEQSYWDYILAERSIEIYEKSLDIANREVEEVKERIQVGKVAETELAAAEAEMASRREQLIEARGNLAKRRLALIRLLNPSGGESVWNREVNLNDAPELSPIQLDGVKTYVQTALDQRADLLQARLQIRQGDLETVRTRNGLLPRLDLFVRLGGSRYASSFSGRNDEDGDDTSYGAGVNFEVPLGNRDARARHERALLSMEQAEASLRNMEQLVQVDVRSAYVDVERAEERVKATRATRELREKTLNNEQEKFRVGRSTMFLVSQARRDMVASQIAEVEAIIEYRKALLDLYRLEGSLLVRRGIRVQGMR